MNYELTAFDVFNDGWVKTLFKVEAPSEEIAELLIKKQLSKLFRDFPAGAILTGGVPFSDYLAPLQPTWTPEWVNNGNTPIWSQGALGSSGHIGNAVFIPSSGFVQGSNGLGGTVNYPSNMMLVSPGQTIYLNGMPIGNTPAPALSITNSTSSTFEIVPEGIQFPNTIVADATK